MSRVAGTCASFCAAPFRAALVCAALCLAGMGTGRASFELRAGDPVGSPLLPAFLPHALGCAALDPDTVWNAAAMHLVPFGVGGLAYDALGVSSGAARVRIGRLAAGGYSETEIDAGTRGPRGCAIEAHLFLTQPSAALAAASGLRPRALLGVSCGLAREWRGLRGTFWIRDALCGPGAAALGVAPRPQVRCELRAGRGWTVALGKEWRSDRPGRGFCALSWDSQATLAAGASWTGAGVTQWCGIDAGTAAVSVWGARAGDGLPGSSGMTVSLRGARGKAGNGGAGPEAGGAAPQRGGAACGPPRAEPPRRPERAADIPPPEDPGEQSDGALLMDDALLDVCAAADSLGAWADSMGTDLPSGSLPAEAEPGPERRPFPPLVAAGDRAQVLELLRKLGGADSSGASVADSIARIFGSPSSGGRPAAATAALRPALLAAAPYLTRSRRTAAGSRFRADPASDPRALTHPSSAGPEPHAGFRWETRPALRTGKPPSMTGAGAVWGRIGSARVEARIHGSAPGGSGAASRTGRWAGSVSIASFRGDAAVGGGGCPIRWGSGILARETAVRLLTAGAGAGAAVLAPSAGEGRSAGADVPVARFGASCLRVTVARTGARAGSGAIDWSGIRLENRAWSAGLLRRSPGASTGSGFSWRVEHRAPGEQIDLECARSSPGRTEGALRWSRVRSASRGRLWWNVLLRDVLPDPRGVPPAPPPGRSRVRHLRRARLGGTVARQSAAFSFEDGGTERTDAASYARVRTLHVRCTGAGSLPGVLRWSARSDFRSRSTSRRSLAQPFGTAADARSGTVRARATATAASGWGVEIGLERAHTRPAGRPETEREARWAGIFRTGQRGAASWAWGLLDIGIDPGAQLGLSPSWSGGVRIPVRVPGLWAAGQMRVRVGGVTAGARFLTRCAGSVRTGGGLEIDLRLGARRS